MLIFNRSKVFSIFLFCTFLASLLLIFLSLYANSYATPAYNDSIQCNLKKSGTYFEGDCWVPNQVNDLAINFDGLKKSYKKSFFPDRRVNAKVFPGKNGYLGNMQGRKVEDPTRFEIVVNKKGDAVYGKLPFGWFKVKYFNVSDKWMNITFDTKDQTLPSKEDIMIVRRAKEILSSPDVWNRKDTRECPPNQESYSIFCAMLKASGEVTGSVHYRQPAMQAFREAINEIGADRIDKHRIQDWNNHPDTTFIEVQQLFDKTEVRLKEAMKVKKN